MDKEFVEEMMEAFLDGMARGWAGGAKSVRSTEFSGLEVIRVESGKFLITDAFYYNEIGRGFGFTIIAHTRIGLGVPFWKMDYWGVYPKSVIDFLKEALHCAYSNQVFSGGRGLSGHEKSDLTYKNNPVLMPFENFGGKERIVSTSNLELGWHQYRGGSLLAWMNI